MSPLAVALTSAGCISAGAVVGLILSKALPGDQLDPDAREAVKVSAGMISLLAALVLGLLVSSAKGNLDAANDAVVQGGARVILLDRVLARYGEETQVIRREMRGAVASMIALLWPDEHPTTSGLEAFERADTIDRMLDAIRGLEPRSESQRALKAQAEQLANELLLNRWLQIEQAHAPLPQAFLRILLFWLTILYVHFGLIAPRRAVVMAVLLVGALSLATAVFLIYEMNSPMEGLIKTSSAPLRRALQELGR